MRRTSLMVPVLTACVLLAASASPARSSPVRPSLTGTATHRHAKAHAAHSGSTVPARSKPLHEKKKAVSTAGCKAPRTAVHGKGRELAKNRELAKSREPARPSKASLRRHGKQSEQPQKPPQEVRRRTRRQTVVTQPEVAAAPTKPVPAPPVPAPVAQPASLSRRRMPIPPPMRGSLESLARQNQKADAEGLERIEDEDDLSDRITHGTLVPVPASTSLTVNADLPDHHRYCRPWTSRFLVDLAHAHEAQFHGSLEVTSAVRTVAYQRHLMHVNGNAAPAEGDIASPHLTGATIDIAKKGLSSQEIGWMRAWLGPLQDAGKIDVEEEFQQSCFHITVYKTYASAPSVPRANPKRTTPQVNRDIASAAPTLGR